MPTLVDIAKKLDISVSLVSKALNGRLGTTGARPELIAEIQRTASEMNYQKNASALALKQGRHNAVGVFIHQFGRPGSGNMDSLLQGLSAKAKEDGQRFILDFFEEAKEFLAFRGMMRKSVMDGVLMGGLPHEELIGVLLELQESGLPIVTILDKEISPLLPNVSFDQVGAGRMATGHLIEQGCRNIVHIVDFEERYNGYCAALHENRIPLREELVYREEGAEFSYGRGIRAARFLLESGVEFDGVVAQSDEEALAVMNVLMDSGIRIPEEVRLIGLDNAPYCEFARVPLSSISQSGVERGRAAFEMLMALINGQSVESTTVAPKLFIRKSTD